MKERYSLQERDCVTQADIWYLRELAVLKGVYYDVRKAQSPTGPDEVSVPNPCGKNLNHLPWTDQFWNTCNILMILLWAVQQQKFLRKGRK